MKVYLVIYEWSNGIDKDIDIEAFDSYEKAMIRFNNRVNEERDIIVDYEDAALDEYDMDECQPNDVLETYAYWCKCL